MVIEVVGAGCPVDIKADEVSADWDFANIIANA